MQKNVEFTYIPEIQVEMCHFKNITQEFPFHFHEHYTIGVITEGTWLSNCEKEETPVSSGSLILINPFEGHACKPLGNGDFEYYGINITAQSIQQNLCHADVDYSPFSFVKSTGKNKEIQDALLDLFHVHNNGLPEKEEKLTFLLTELIHFNCENNTGLPESDQKYVWAIKKMLDLNYRESFSLKDLSLIFGVSKFQVLRSFTKYLGLSPYRYLESVRIHHAKKLLQLGVKPIDVCYDTGFNDQSQFTKIFKRIMGVTPKRYQQFYITKG